jgi:hypothetical protein
LLQPYTPQVNTPRASRLAAHEEGPTMMKELVTKLLYRVSLTEMKNASEIVIQAYDSGSKFELQVAINYLNEIRSRAQDLLDSDKTIEPPKEE